MLIIYNVCVNKNYLLAFNEVFAQIHITNNSYVIMGGKLYATIATPKSIKNIK